MKMKKINLFIVLMIVVFCISTYCTINSLNGVFDRVDKRLDEVLDKIDEPFDITDITFDELDKFYETYVSWQDKMLGEALESWMDEILDESDESDELDELDELDEPMLSLSYVEWYTTTEEVAGGFTFGFLHLKLAGFVNADIDKVTVETWGDGLLNETEISLFTPKCKDCYWSAFNDDVEIAFTHEADQVSRRYKTVLKAYKSGVPQDCVVATIDLQSDWLVYLK